MTRTRLFGAALLGVTIAFVERTIHYEVLDKERREREQLLPASNKIEPSVADGILSRTGIPSAGQLQKFDRYKCSTAQVPSLEPLAASGFHRSFISWADYRTKCPQYVIERITKDSLEGPANRKYCHFRGDESIPHPFRCVWASSTRKVRRNQYDLMA